MHNRALLLPIVFLSFGFSAWSQPYTISTVAGTDRLLDGHNASGVPLREPGAIALDASGNLYIVDSSDNRIRKVDLSGNISTYAGTGLPGYNGDRLKATAAQLNNPSSIAFDNSGNLYVADLGNSRVRIISPSGIIDTVAGNGSPGILGDNGPALSAQLDPLTIALDNQGNLFIATSDFRIRKVDVNGIITTIAGDGTNAYSGDNGPAKDAAISIVAAMVCDAKGNLYIADTGNGYVRMITTAGVIEPVAGVGDYQEGFIIDYVPAQAAVMSPDGLALDSSGNNLYIADTFLNSVRLVDMTTTLIHTVAGNGNGGFLGDGGPPLQAELSAPAGVALDSSNDIYVADFGNKRIRKVTGSTITTVAGTSIGDGGPATAAFLNFPEGVAVDSANNLVVADFGNSEAREFTLGGAIAAFGQLNGTPIGVAADASGNFFVTDNEPLVLEISKAGVTSIIAGDSQPGYSGDKGPATSAMISSPTGVAVDTSDNVYFTDYSNHKIRKVTSSTGVITTIAGDGTAAYSGDSGPALSAGMDPFDVALDSQGNLYVADFLNSRVRKITPAGIITTVAGNGAPGYSGDGGPAMAAKLNAPSGVAVDYSGNLYIADRGNGVLRRVDTLGLITTIAGTGVSTPSIGDGGPAIAAQLDPFRLSLDGVGNVYVADSLNDRVRMLTPLITAPASMSIVSGNQQSATVGTALSSPLVLKVSSSAGAGVAGVVVNFSVTPAGAATVSPSPAVTLNDGTVTANVTLGNTAGSVTIQASANGVPDVSFSVTATPAISPTAPVISANGIVSGGLSGPPLTAVAPNAIATIFGDKFAPAGTARQVGQQDLLDGKIPTNLAGACAKFGTQFAPILNVYPGQLNVQVPQLAPGVTQVQVITQCGTPQAQTSNLEAVTIQAAAPEFFYFLHSGTGHNPIAAINAITKVNVGNPGLAAGGTFAPAQRGDLLTLFGTGLGATNPPFSPGELPQGAAQVTAPVSITFGGVTLAASDILYAGVTQNAGLYQVNLRVPAQVPDGDQAVVITIGGVASPPGGFITVKGTNATPSAR